MSLRDRIHRGDRAVATREMTLFKTYGVSRNPFPAASQPFGHPHLETKVDDEIVESIQDFENTHNTQVLVIEGTQGVGKTNLLNYYQDELEDVYQNDKTFYIIRYYPDPEPSFDSIIRRVLQELGEQHLEGIANALKKKTERDQSAVVDIAKNHEVRLVLHSLKRAATHNKESLGEISALAMEWFLGLRVLKLHREELGIRFRLDTVESKTQALRDLIYVGVELGVLKGIFLLLDELEKQDYSLTKTPVLRYLLAIRALIDALPTHLFLMLALTLEARRRYFNMLPAIAGRLKNTHTLSPLEKVSDGVALYDLYLEHASQSARTKTNFARITSRNEQIFNRSELKNIFHSLSEESAERGIKGVTHRDFLDELHKQTQEAFNNLLAS